MADVGCRNTVFGAEAQEASRHLDQWQEIGIQHYRLEFVHESGDDVARISTAFAETLAGECQAGALGKMLEQFVPNGTTEGSLFVPDLYR